MSERQCETCEEKTEFYIDEHKQERCSICEQLFNLQSEPSPETVPAPEWNAEVPPEGKELLQVLDHIRIDFQGDFRNQDLKGLLEEFQDMQKALEETGRPLKLIVSAIKKSKVKMARDKGDLIIPFRDRHGKPIPGSALHLPFRERKN